MSAVHGKFVAGEYCFVSAMVAAENEYYGGTSVGVSGERSEESDCRGTTVEASRNERR